MEAYRMIINSRKLKNIIELPDDLQESEVEIIVLPIGKSGKNNKIKKSKGKLRQNWAGALQDYRDHYTSLELQKKALDWRG